MNLHKIRSFPLLKELIRYSDDGNYDRVMAFMMIMYFIQETRRHEILDKQEVINLSRSSDSFFQKPIYRKRRAFKFRK